MAPDVVWSGPVTYLPPPPSTGYVLGDLARLDDPRPARPAPPLGAQQRGADPRLFWSLSFALHRDAWLRTGGFCEDYVGYGGEDTDFGQVAVACGLELGWTGSARACHQHHESHDPPVRHTADIVRNGRIFHDRWGWWPMTLAGRVQAARPGAPYRHPLGDGHPTGAGAGREPVRRATVTRHRRATLVR